MRGEITNQSDVQDDMGEDEEETDGEEDEEMAVVSSADAVPDKEAVVVEGADTVVAHLAVMCPWRSPYPARVAVTDRDLDAFHHNRTDIVIHIIIIIALTLTLTLTIRDATIAVMRDDAGIRKDTRPKRADIDKEEVDKEDEKADEEGMQCGEGAEGEREAAEEAVDAKDDDRREGDKVAIPMGREVEVEGTEATDTGAGRLWGFRTFRTCFRWNRHERK